MFLGCSVHLFNPASASVKGFCKIREGGADGISLGKADTKEINSCTRHRTETEKVDP